MVLTDIDVSFLVLQYFIANIISNLAGHLENILLNNLTNGPAMSPDFPYIFLTFLQKKAKKHFPKSFTFALFCKVLKNQPL